MLDARFLVEGHAIVSADGMIADAVGGMPPTLRSEVDWRLFQQALDAAAVVVLGRIGHARHPNPGRRRLVLTRGVAAVEKDPLDPRSTLWHPAGVELGEVLSEMGISAGTIAVTGGTGTFNYFLPHYDRFVLAEAQDAVLPGGTPCFAAGHPRSVLAEAGLVPTGFELLEPGITRTTWVRR